MPTKEWAFERAENIVPRVFSLGGGGCSFILREESVVTLLELRWDLSQMAIRDIPIAFRSRPAGVILDFQTLSLDIGLDTSRPMRTVPLKCFSTSYWAVRREDIRPLD